MNNVERMDSRTQDWMDAIAAANKRDREIEGYLMGKFPGSKIQVGCLDSNRRGYRTTKRFGRRTWTIEVFAKADNEWHAGLYIQEQIGRNNYFWEVAKGSTPEEAIDHLSLRIAALSKELEMLAGEELSN